MKHAPLTRQRSAWVDICDLTAEMGHPTTQWERRVHDGLLLALVSQEPAGLHLSISHRTHRGDTKRYPTWDEIMHARSVLLPHDIAFVIHLPVADEYVALHPTCFHLHQEVTS